MHKNLKSRRNSLLVATVINKGGRLSMFFFGNPGRALTDTYKD